MEDYPAQAMKEASGIDRAMASLETEVSDIENVVSDLIGKLHAVLIPAQEPPCQVDSNAAVGKAPSLMTTNLQDQCHKLKSVTSQARSAISRLDI